MHRTIARIVTLAYASVALGLPLPVGTVADVPGVVAPGGGIAAGRLAAKDRSRPFPCMNSPCGCGSAEQCFESCCCHTPAERLAWARRHGLGAAVTDALERRVAAAVIPAAPDAGRPAGGSCCSSAAASAPADAESCCDTGPAEATPGPAAAQGSRDEASSAAPAVGVTGVTLRAMLACQGLLTQWLSVSGSLPPPRVDGAERPLPVGVIDVRDVLVPSPAGAPEPPPPEGR
ncbi:MAG: hypothetical protein ACKO5R_11430 [Planctomycetaceae bacterium]